MGQLGREGSGLGWGWNGWLGWAGATLKSRLQCFLLQGTHQLHEMCLIVGVTNSMPANNFCADGSSDDAVTELKGPELSLLASQYM